ncbi:F-box domain-containing [Fusarium albosuccineum]|uniref:F-box domain-containing n=1 Tax=Fusarium albosuccineum TaxID=1237068 RepID=A0A8H4PEH2_9HYPO|nr:F-box domain-containing [Fusarium albosuccineum]
MSMFDQDKYDAYCAICGVVLFGWESEAIGSQDARALERRRRRVQRKREGIDTRQEDVADRRNIKYKPRDWDPEAEDEQYDPDLVSEESLDWLNCAACLGHNPLAVDEHRAFLADIWFHRPHCSVDIRSLDDPAEPDERRWTAFACYDRAHHDDFGSPREEDLKPAVFPLHKSCYEMLEKVFTSANPSSSIDRDVLYDAMAPLSYALATSLDINYGKMSGRARLWESIPGEEFTVTNPNDTEAFYGYLRERIASRIFDAPTEVRLADSRPELDYRKLYIWLNTTTEPRYGVESPFLAIANRRRIWGTCTEILGHYYKLAAKQVATEPDPKIVQQSKCPLLLKVAPTHAPRLDRIHQTWWIHSWEEIHDSAFDFETFWNDDDFLVGIGVVIGKSRRIFGTANGRKIAVRIPSKDWISSMVLYLGNKPGSSTDPVVAIRGVTLNAGLKGHVFLRADNCNYGSRHIFVSEGRNLVGVEGQIRQDGVIARIGILECPSPQQAPRDAASPPPIDQKLVWKYIRGEDPCIWQRPDIEISPVFPLNFEERCPEDDLSTYDLLYWRNKKRVFETLYRITGHTPRNKPGSPVLGLGYGGQPEDEKTHLALDVANGEKLIAIGANEGETLKGIMLRTNKDQKVVFGQGETDLENWKMAAPPEGNFITGVLGLFDIDAKTREKGKLSSLLMIHQPLDDSSS